MVTPLTLLNPAAHGTSDLALARWKVCRECPRLAARSVCSSCGCVMKLKVKLTEATCPENRWES